MNTFEFNYYGNDIVAHNKILFNKFPLELFNPICSVSNHSLQCKEVNALNKAGRGSVRILKYNEQDLALRHYYRGGMMAKFIHDRYLWQGLHKTRALLELQILFAMREMDLPVPIPVAAHVHRVGFAYTANIVTQLIPQSQSLSSVLIKTPVPAKIWRDIGTVIRNFHRKNCNHNDLNAHNILLDAGARVFLIDFDKSKIETSHGTWQQKNLARLQRSLDKLKKTAPIFNYSQQDFKALMEGYNHG